MTRPDDRYLNAIEIISRHFSNMHDPLVFVAVCIAYVIDSATAQGKGLLLKDDSLAAQGVLQDILIKILMERVKDPAVLDYLATALAAVI
jgi:uncharacterized PurR-regulated membrane protein YhhQ (DUF165 family)